MVSGPVELDVEVSCAQYRRPYLSGASYDTYWAIVTRYESDSYGACVSEARDSRNTQHVYVMHHGVLALKP